MVKIRLTRTGKRHDPHYRIVAADSHGPRDGKYLEKIGYYNPRTKPPTLHYDKDILQKWLDNGAQMTDTVSDIFVREGVIKQSKKRKRRIELKVEHSKKRKAEEAGEHEGKEESEGKATSEPESKKDADAADAKEIAKRPEKKEDTPKKTETDKKMDTK